MARRRCESRIRRMTQSYSLHKFETIARALEWLVREHPRQPLLGELAAVMNMSEAHAQKTFQRFAGVTPKQFVQLLNRESALKRLRQGQSVLEAALDSGLSGPGRLHDLLITTDALTPGQARRLGGGVEMSWGTGATPFGQALVAWAPRGITFLAFTLMTTVDDAWQQLLAQWPDADFHRDHEQAQARLGNMFERPAGQDLEVWLRGSPFQLKIWSALLAIPPGWHASYAQIAKLAGHPAAARAAGSAIGSNPVAWLIPCHRVITGLGQFGGYRWGVEVKQAMIGVEAGRRLESGT